MKNSEKFNDLDDEFNVCLKTFQNDMVYIRKYLGDNLTKKGNCYKLLKKDSLENFFKDNHAEIKKFFHAISLIDQSVFGENFKKYAPLLETIREEQKGVYLFLENPFENLKHLDLKSKLERCIRDKRYIDIDYYSDKEHIFTRVRSYKIIYQNGSWYLATITTNDYEVNGGFKMLRLNFIRNIEYSKAPTNFHEDIQVKDFLENKFQSLFTSFDKEFFTVRLKVDNRAARFFKVKKYLKSQRIIEETEDYIIVELITNDDMEIIPLVQRWLPHVKVLEPKYIHEKILKNIAKYS
jgi:predicted DNA-binding transcriptional regulator YafY